MQPPHLQKRTVLLTRQLEARVAPAVFNIPNGDTAALVAAITACNTNNQPDTINLAAGGNYVFTNSSDNVHGNHAVPVVAADNGNSFTLNGNGATVRRSTAPGTPGFRFIRIGVFFGPPAEVPFDAAINRLIIRDFDTTQQTSTYNSSGAAVFVAQPGTVRLTDCEISGNRAINAGAITTGGQSAVTLVRCKVVGNTNANPVGSLGVIGADGGRSLTLQQCTVADNLGPHTGGVWITNGGSLTIVETTIRGHVNGFGVDNFGTPTVIVRSEIAGNENGIEITSLNSSLDMTDSTVSRNAGYGIYAKQRVSIANSTISDNGGIGFVRNAAIFADPDIPNPTAGDAVITNCTFAGNAGGGIRVEPIGPGSGSTFVRLRNSVLANGVPDVIDNQQLVVSAGYNLVRDGTGANITPGPGDRIGTTAAPIEARLGPLADNGGPTQTRVPLAGSPLIDLGDPAFTPPPANDQRGPGFPRIVAGRVDIGAVEATADVAVTVTDSRNIVATNRTTTYTAVIHNVGSQPAVAVPFSVSQPPGVTFAWTSTSAGGASGNAPSGTGPIAEVLSLPPGSSVSYTIVATVAATASGQIVVVAQASVPPGIVDPFATNNSAVDTDAILAGGKLIVVAGDAGGPPDVKLVGARDGLALATITAYDPLFLGGVHTAAADINDDGVAEIVTGPGPGGGPHVRVFDGATGAVIREFMAYESSFRGGVYVAAGDGTGDSVPDIATAPGPGGGPFVKVFNGATGALVRSFFAYDARFRGGATVALGDVNGDNRADVVTGAGVGGAPHIKVFSGTGGVLLHEFMAYESTFRGGVFVAAGDVDGDGRADIITGTGTGGGPFVKAFRGSDATLVRSFFAYNAAFRGGVRVTSTDVTGDGRADIATGAGPGGGPHVRTFDGTSGAAVGSFIALDPAFLGGVFVGAG